MPIPATHSQHALVELLTERVLEMLDRGAGSPIVVIDGRAGSGKSTLAEILQQRLFKVGESLPRVIHMDDLYEGWTGLQAGSDYLCRFILKPLRQGDRAHWQEYNWELGERERWREFEGGTPLIVEGCGSLSKLSAELTDIRVWLEVDSETRHARWIAREGHRFDDQWPIWAAQEEEFYARERSNELADLTGGAE